MPRPSRFTPCRALWLWGPLLAYMAVIFYVSSIPEPPLPPSLTDKQGHSLSYTLLGMLALRALACGEWARVSWRTVASAVLLTTMYGVSDELHQAFVPGREASVPDVIADAVGAAIGAGLLWTWSIIGPVRTRSQT